MGGATHERPLELWGGPRADPRRRSRGRGRAVDRRSVPPHPVSDPARGGRPRGRRHPRDAVGRARSRPRPRHPAAAAALRRGLLHPAASAPAERAADRRARDRAGAGNDGRGRRRGPLRARLRLGGGLRPRRDRRPDRSRRRDGDRPPAGPAEPDRDDRRGRGADQRRDRAGRLQVRRGRRRHRQLQPRRRRPALRRRCRRRRRDRDRGRGGGRLDPVEARQPPGRDHDRAVHLLLRLPPGRGRGRLGRARRRHRGHLHGPAHVPPDRPDDEAAGQRRLGDPRLPGQLGAVHADRAAAAVDPRRPRRRRRHQPDSRRGADRGGGDRDADPLGLPADLPALAAVGPRRRATAMAQHPDRRLDGNARRGLAGGRTWRCR